MDLGVRIYKKKIVRMFSCVDIKPPFYNSTSALKIRELLSYFFKCIFFSFGQNKGGST